MSNLGLLIKINIINEFNLNKIKTLENKENVKILAIIFSSIALIGYFIYVMFKLCFEISEILIQYNQMDLLLVIGFVGALLFSLFTTLYKSSSYLFEAKDFESLISLPIKESAILLSKIVMLLLSNYLFTSPFIFIPSIVYAIKMNVSIAYFINLVVMFLCIPLIPIIISSIIAFLLGGISSKLRYKNAILIIGSIALLVIYMIVMSQIEEIGKNILANSSSILEGIKKLYFLAYYYIEGLKNNNLIDVLIFVGISLVLFIGFITIFANRYKSINSKMNESYKSKKYELKELKISSKIQSLLEKEFKRYFSSYIYFLNTSMGMILLIIFSLGIVIFGADKISALLELNLDFAFIKVQMLGIILFCVVISCTTYCSISLEGKNLWILKSLPIDEVDIFKSKIILNLFLNMPISIICFILIGLKLKFEATFIIIGSLLIASMSILVAVLGLFLNLLYPNLNWKNEVAVVKRSFSIIAVMVFAIIYIGIYAFVYFKFNIINLNTFLIIPIISTIIINFIIWNLIKNKGVKKFRNI